MNSAREDRELLDAALAGDVRRRHTLVLSLRPVVQARVMHALLRYKRGREAAQAVDDLTQQVFLSLFEDGGRKLRAWRPERGASLSTYVGLLAEREVIGLLRRGRRNPWTESPTEDVELTRCVGASDGHESLIANREVLDVVLDRALATLDEHGLQLFQRLIVDEATADTVAREAGSTESALHMWKSRFTKLIREIGDEITGEKHTPSPKAHAAFALVQARAR